jgi:hypothetical protein
VSFGPASLEAEGTAEAAADPLGAGATGAALLVDGRADAEPGTVDPWTVSAVAEGFASPDD